MDVETRYVNEKKYNELKRFNIRGGDIIVSCRGTIGETFIVPDDAPLGIMHPSIMKIRLREGVYDKSYFNDLLHTRLKKHEAEANGSGVKMAISANKLGDELFPVPTIIQQRAIEEKIRIIRDLLEFRKEELKRLEDLIKARFVEMFGDININDKGWDLQPLGNLCTIVRGGSPRPIDQFLGGTVPWIKIGDATEGDSIYLNSTKEHIIEEGVKKSRLIKSGSLIFANCGVSLGFARIITFEGCIHDGWLAMEDIDERLDKVFLLQSLNQMTEYFRTIAPAGTQPNLNTAIMKAYMQIIPPMSMQREFIAFVAQVDKSKVA